MRDDETKRAERAEQIALFRYGLISDLLHPAAGDETRRLYERLREKAAKSYCIPGSRRTHVAVETLRDWLCAYKAGGFDALRPKPRADIGRTRAIPQLLADLLVMVKDEHRDWSVAMVIDAAKEMDETARAMSLPVSTVHRLLSRAGVMGKRPEDATSKDRRRFAHSTAILNERLDLLGESLVEGHDARLALAVDDLHRAPADIDIAEPQAKRLPRAKPGAVEDLEQRAERERAESRPLSDLMDPARGPKQATHLVGGEDVRLESWRARREPRFWNDDRGISAAREQAELSNMRHLKANRRRAALAGPRQPVRCDRVERRALALAPLAPGGEPIEGPKLGARTIVTAAQRSLVREERREDLCERAREDRPGHRGTVRQMPCSRAGATRTYVDNEEGLRWPRISLTTLGGDATWTCIVAWLCRSTWAPRPRASRPARIAPWRRRRRIPCTLSGRWGLAARGRRSATAAPCLVEHASGKR